MISRSSVLLVPWLVLAALPAVAQEAELPPHSAAAFRSHWDVGLGAHLALGVGGDRCVQDGDVVSCSNFAMIAFDFTPRYHLVREFSIGGLALLGKGDSVSLLRFAVEARFHPLGHAASIDPSVGVDAGAALVLDRVPRTEVGGSDSWTTATPAFGASVGVDFALGETVSLGLVGRFVWLAMGDRDSYFSREPTYSNPLMLSGGLVGTYHFGS